MLLLFVASAVVAAFRGPADASHISAYLATLGGLMGAIFTAGGLVIALVAVLPFVAQLCVESTPTTRSVDLARI